MVEFCNIVTNIEKNNLKSQKFPICQQERDNVLVL